MQRVVEGGMQINPRPQRFEQSSQSGFRISLQQELNLFHSLQWLAVQRERKATAQQAFNTLPCDHRKTQCLQHIVLYRLIARLRLIFHDRSFLLLAAWAMAVNFWQFWPALQQA
ncbi:hypothetical protein D3C77_642550 [compost metagenome]